MYSYSEELRESLIQFLIKVEIQVINIRKEFSEKKLLCQRK